MQDFLNGANKIIYDDLVWMVSKLAASLPYRWQHRSPRLLVS